MEGLAQFDESAQPDGQFEQPCGSSWLRRLLVSLLLAVLSLQSYEQFSHDRWLSFVPLESIIVSFRRERDQFNVNNKQETLRF